MSKDKCVTLRNHKLYHIPEIRVNENVLKSRFLAGCATTRCKANCCKDGVWTDPSERDHILAHAELIKLCMDENQEKDPTHWFDPEESNDPDFPSGRAIGTQVRDGGCVFLNSTGRCVLQKATQDQTGDLKPFFCTAFPITIVDGELLIDEGKDPGCCEPVSCGPLTVLDVCSQELKYVLGDEGFKELKVLFGA